MNKSQQQEAEQNRQESLEYLRSILKPGDTVKTLVRSVASSGMSRRISLFVARDNEVIDITWHAARAMGEPIKQRGQYVQDAGLWVSGCGMDMCFHTVYNLGRTLFPDGFGVACRKCGFRKDDPSGSNMVYRQGPCQSGHQFIGRNGDTSGWDNDGGYALHKSNL